MQFVIILIVLSIFGWIAESINRERGLSEKYYGFVWGFFFGVLGILLVALRPRE